MSEYETPMSLLASWALQDPDRCIRVQAVGENLLVLLLAPCGEDTLAIAAGFTGDELEANDNALLVGRLATAMVQLGDAALVASAPATGGVH